MNCYDDLQKQSPLYFREDEVEIDHFRQPLLQFRSRLLNRVRITEIIDEKDFFTSIRGTYWAVTRLIGYF